MRIIYFSVAFLIMLNACKKESTTTNTIQYSAVDSIFNGEIDLNNLENYANQSKPNYINKDNTNSNSISDKGATLGRILFYDKNLSVNNTTSCGSCHKQSLAFGDNVVASIGVNGTTGRHSMRLINARFTAENKFFLG